jgi:hypothetical protein
MLSILYGRNEPSLEEPIFHEFEHYIDTFNAYLHPSSLRPVDIFPFLRYLPSWMPWNKQIDDIRNMQNGLFSKLLKDFNDANAKNNDQEGFMKEVCGKAKELGINDFEKLAYVLLLIIYQQRADFAIDSLLELCSMVDPKRPQERCVLLL